MKATACTVIATGCLIGMLHLVAPEQASAATLWCGPIAAPGTSMKAGNIVCSLFYTGTAGLPADASDELDVIEIDGTVNSGATTSQSGTTGPKQIDSTSIPLNTVGSQLSYACRITLTKIPQSKVRAEIYTYTQATTGAPFLAQTVSCKFP